MGLEEALFPLGDLMAQQLTAPAFIYGSEEIAAVLHWQDYKWVYIFALAIGFATTVAEPALIAVAIKAQDVSGGAISVWGLRIAVAIGVASILAIAAQGDFSLMMVIQRMFGGVDSFHLMAVPLFMFAGVIMEAGGISRRMIDFEMARRFLKVSVPVAILGAIVAHEVHEGLLVGGYAVLVFVLAFGILFATVITLFLIPSLYLVLDDFGKWWREAWSHILPRKPRRGGVRAGAYRRVGEPAAETSDRPR